MEKSTEDDMLLLTLFGSIRVFICPVFGSTLVDLQKILVESFETFGITFAPSLGGRAMATSRVKDIPTSLLQDVLQFAKVTHVVIRQNCCDWPRKSFEEFALACNNGIPHDFSPLTKVIYKFKVTTLERDQLVLFKSEIHPTTRCFGSEYGSVMINDNNFTAIIIPSWNCLDWPLHKSNQILKFVKAIERVIQSNFKKLHPSEFWISVELPSGYWRLTREVNTQLSGKCHKPLRNPQYVR